MFPQQKHTMMRFIATVSILLSVGEGKKLICEDVLSSCHPTESSLVVGQFIRKVIFAEGSSLPSSRYIRNVGISLA